MFYYGSAMMKYHFECDYTSNLGNPYIQKSLRNFSEGGA